MIKQSSLLTLLCLSLLGLSACSTTSEDKKKDMADQSVEAPAVDEVRTEAAEATKVADNDVVESDVARTDDRKEV